MFDEVYSKANDFLMRNPGTIAWRVKAHCKVAAAHIDKDEEILYAFAAQKGASALDMIWGRAIIDTIKETVILSNLSRGALIEIENALTKYMMKHKAKNQGVVVEEGEAIGGSETEIEFATEKEVGSEAVKKIEDEKEKEGEDE